MPVLAAILLFAAAVLAALNWGCVWRNLRARGGHHSSPVLLIGVFVGALGLASWPERPRFAWLLLFGDPGTPLGIAALPRLLVAMFHFSRLNLHAEYVGSEHRLRLYRHGEFLLSFNPLDRSKHPVPLTTGAGGTWSQTNDVLTLSLLGTSVPFQVVHKGNRASLSGAPVESPMNLAGVTLEESEA